MKNTWNYLDRIEAWKNNELDAEAKKEFEFDLMHNPALAEEVEAYHNLVENIETYGDKRTQKTIEPVVAKLDKEGFFNNPSEIIKPTETKQKSGAFRLMAVAASLTILVVSGLFLFNLAKDKNTVPEIAMYQFEKDALNVTIDKLTAASFSNPEKGKDDSLAKALILYTEGKYSLARMALLQYLNSYPEDQTASLYLGMAYKDEGQYGKAAKYLSPLTSVEDVEIRNVAKWNAYQCYVTFGTESDIKTAKTLLQELVDDVSSGYSDYAKPQLDLLKRK